MKTQAAILVETGKPLVIDELEIPVLKPGQVLVEIGYTCVCHTQLGEVRGKRGADPWVPHCLGHEGSGRVLETGPGVAKVKADDAVILSWIKGSGADVPGTTYLWNGKKVNAGAITTFARRAVISENRLFKIGPQTPMREAAMLGCAVPTGFGVVFNTARPKPGMSLAVFGAGGVGLCAVAAAATAGCYPVIAVDLVAEKLAQATRLGATHTIKADICDPAEQIKALCPRGLDVAIETTGVPAVMGGLLNHVRPQGGIAVIVGNAPFGSTISLDPKQFNMGKILKGSWGGENVPDADFPRYLSLLESGQLNLSEMLSPAYSLESINDAMDDLENGRVIRPLIDLN